MGRVHEGVEDAILQHRPDLRLVLNSFLNEFDVTWGRDMRLYGSEVNAFILRPQKSLQQTFGFDKELLLIHHQYSAVQPRIFHIANQIMSESPCAGRVEPLLFLLVSAARGAEDRVKQLVSDTSQNRVIIPFGDEECKTVRDPYLIRNRISKYLFDRDLFDMSRPLGSDLYFFGRNAFVMTLRDAIRQGENIGLFGLRRTGKTSLLLRLKRLIEAEGSGRLVYLDLEDQDLYQLRWWTLLERIARSMPGTKGLPSFEEHTASELFRGVVSKQKKKKQALVVALDEIEHIVPGERLRMREHWDEDFVELWKSIRAIQNVNRHVSFIVCGTNATPLETSTYGGRDNPLFGMAVRHYAPSFTRSEVRQMVRTLGRFMGMHFAEECYDYLKERYGGHPFITRQACSVVFNHTRQQDRPIHISREFLEKSERERDLALFQYAEHILGVLRSWYPEEYAMLEYLASGDVETFKELESDVPEFSAHLRAYEMVAEDPPKLTYAFVGSYLRNQEAARERRRSLVVDDREVKKEGESRLDKRLAELGFHRNRLEQKLRRFIRMILIAQKGPLRWIDPVLSALPEERRDKLTGVDRDEILTRHLFFIDLLQVMKKNWNLFKQIEQQPTQQRITKTELQVLLDFINKHREDAHAKEVGAPEVAAVGVAAQAIEAAIDPYLK